MYIGEHGSLSQFTACNYCVIVRKNESVVGIMLISYKNLEQNGLNCIVVIYFLSFISVTGC